MSITYTKSFAISIAQCTNFQKTTANRLSSIVSDQSRLCPSVGLSFPFEETSAFVCGHSSVKLNDVHSTSKHEYPQTLSTNPHIYVLNLMPSSAPHTWVSLERSLVQPRNIPPWGGCTLLSINITMFPEIGFLFCWKASQVCSFIDI
jgi:hypothetical protein